MSSIEADASRFTPIPAELPADTVAVHLVDRILRAAIELGASRPALLEGLGIHEDRLRHPLARLSEQVLIRLLAAIDRELRDPVLILRLAQIARPTCFSDIGYISRYAESLGAVLENQVGNQVLLQNMSHMVLEPKNDPPRVRWRIDAGRAEYLAPAAELTLGIYFTLCRAICAPAMVVEHVTFQHAPRFDPAAYAAAFRCPISFSAEHSAIEFGASALSLPAPMAHGALVEQGRGNYNKMITWLAEGLECTAHGYFYLSTQLNKTPLTLDRMALAFGMSERTLRRKLDAEGTPFRTLLDDVRKDMCALYRTEALRPLSEVALLLGYAELSAFTRAYRRWYGEPPSARWSE